MKIVHQQNVQNPQHCRLEGLIQNDRSQGAEDSILGKLPDLLKRALTAANNLV